MARMSPDSPLHPHEGRITFNPADPAASFLREGCERANFAAKSGPIRGFQVKYVMTMAASQSGFPPHCGGPFDLTSAHTISCYELQPTTLAEMAIISYLSHQPDLYANKSILHVGIGNGSMYSALHAHLAAYVGLTISLPEKHEFQVRFTHAQNATVLLANKHDPRVYPTIPGRFDLIVDVNLKSYACCEAHFQSMMRFYVERLRSGGQIITAETGLVFGWPGNTQRAFTPGADPNPEAAQHRALGVGGLRRLAEEYGMLLNSVCMCDIRHLHGSADGEHMVSDETVWFLERA